MTETNTGKVNIENPEQASTNFYWTFDSGGQVFNMQTTVRGALTFEQVKLHIKTAMEAIAHVQELGGVAKQVGSSAYQEAKSAAATIPTVPSMDEINAQMEQAEKHEEAHEQNSHEQSALTFETEMLTCEVKMDGETPKQFFKIKGGMYKKFGITVWPEVLSAAGIPVAKLKGQDYKLPGYIATFVLNDKGKPSKVVKLEKVA